MLHCAPFSSFAASPPNFATTFHDAIPLLFRSNFLSWQMHSLLRFTLHKNPSKTPTILYKKTLWVIPMTLTISVPLFVFLVTTSSELSFFFLKGTAMPKSFQYCLKSLPKMKLPLFVFVFVLTASEAKGGETIISSTSYVLASTSSSNKSVKRQSWFIIILRLK